MKKGLEKIFWSLLTQLISEKFAKKLVLRVFRWIVEKTKTNKDNELFNDICEAWGMNKEDIKAV